MASDSPNTPAVIAGLFGIVIAVIGGIFLVVTKSDPTGSPQQPNTSVTPSRKPNCDEQFQIVSPRESTKISSGAGAVIEGSACDSEIVWVFDFDPSDGTYYQTEDHPVKVSNGRWRQLDAPIGVDTDPPGTLYTVLALRVTPACSQKLAAGSADNDGTVLFNPIPRPCPTVDDTANTRIVHLVNGGA